MRITTIKDGRIRNTEHREEGNLIIPENKPMKYETFVQVRNSKPFANTYTGRASATNFWSNVNPNGSDARKAEKRETYKEVELTDEDIRNINARLTS